MADVQPLRALHYDLATRGLARRPRRAALRRDRRRAARRARRALAVQRRRDRPPVGGDDPYAQAGRALRALAAPTACSSATGSRRCGRSSSAIAGPDGAARTRRGFFARVARRGVRAGRIRPHERTHPGPGGPAAPDARDAREPLADLRPLLRSRRRRARRARGLRMRGAPWGEVTDADGTVNRLWRCATRPRSPQPSDALADAELLIADGHHRYETARVYAEEIGGEGDHRYVLMCLVALEDPGLEHLPDAPPRRRPRRRTPPRARGRDRARLRQRSGRVADELAPPPGSGPLELGYLDAAGAPAADARATRRSPTRARRHAAALPRARHRRARGAAAEGRARPQRRRHLAPPRPRLRARCRGGDRDASRRRATTPRS